LTKRLKSQKCPNETSPAIWGKHPRFNRVQQLIDFQEGDQLDNGAN